MFSQFQTGKYNGKLFVPSCNGFEIFAGSIEQGEKFEFNHYQANVDYLFRMPTLFTFITAGKISEVFQRSILKASSGFKFPNLRCTNRETLFTPVAVSQLSF